MSAVPRRIPPLKLILAIALVVALLQLPIGEITANVSVSLGVLINEIFVIALLPIVALWIFGYSARPLLPFGRSDSKHALVAVCLTFGVAILITYFKNLSERFIPIPEIVLTRHEQIIVVHSWNDFFLKLLMLSLVTAVCEELFFRGILQNSFMARFGNWRAIVITAALFALFHSTSFQPQLLLVLGFLFSWIYSVTGTLRIPIICHAINNTWVLVNQIFGNQIPIEHPAGRLDFVVIGSAIIIATASIVWLNRNRRPPKLNSI